MLNASFLLVALAIVVLLLIAKRHADTISLADGGIVIAGGLLGIVFGIAAAAIMNHLLVGG